MPLFLNIILRGFTIAIICDIDNTLLLRGTIPLTKTIRSINLVPDVYLVTGRMESERARTILALQNAHVKYIRLLMNSTGQTQPQAQIRSKRSNAARIMLRTNVTQAIDDDPAARTMYRALGIPVVTSP